MRWWRAVPVGMAVVLFGCSPSPPAPSQVADRLAHYDNGAISFGYPVQWNPHYFPENFDEGGLVTYLSTQAVHDQCQRAPGRLACAWPVSRLEPGAVLITWWTTSIPATSGLTAEGGARLITINGQPASVLVSSPGACAELAGQSTISVTISPGPGWYLTMTACLSGPDLALHEQEVMTMVGSTKIRFPTPAPG
jgi:hypothetical protein